MQKGFTLLELITVFVIISLLLVLTVPNIYQFLMRQERELALHRLNTAIEYARQEAKLRGQTVTLCPTADHKTCKTKIDDWTDGFMAILNVDRDPKAYQVLQVFPGLQHGQLHFEQWGSYLNIRPDGTTRNLGAFTYCPKNRDRRDAEALVINAACRTYRPIARNALGVRLKKEGTPEATPLTCR